MGGDSRIYVLDMGQPVLISELAEQLIRLSGKEPEKDIKIVYTGLRAGEKLHEELFHDEESLSSTDYEKIHLAATRSVDPDVVNDVYEKIAQKLDNFDSSLSECIRILVPEYAGGDLFEGQKTA